MAKKKLIPNPSDEEDVLGNEQTDPVEDSESVFPESEEAVDSLIAENISDAESYTENLTESDVLQEDLDSDGFGEQPAGAPLPSENDVSALMVEAEKGDYGALLEVIGVEQTAGLQPTINDTPEGDMPVAMPLMESAFDMDAPEEELNAPPKNWSPSYTAMYNRVLTIDAGEKVETVEDREATLWHEIQNAYRTHRILTGTLDSIERKENGMRLAVVNYKGFRVAIPLKEMMLDSNHIPDGKHYADQMERLIRILSSRLGSEIDFIIKGIENKTRSIVASRKEAMLKKRKTFYLDEDAQGQCMIYEGRIVQARVVAVADKMIRVEVFGVECMIHAQGLAWEWIGDAHEKFSVGDRVLVRVLTIEKDDVEHIEIAADIRSVYAETNP